MTTWTSPDFNSLYRDALREDARKAREAREAAPPAGGYVSGIWYADTEPCDRCGKADFRSNGTCFGCDPADLEAEWAREAEIEQIERTTGKRRSDFTG